MRSFLRFDFHTFGKAFPNFDEVYLINLQTCSSFQQLQRVFDFTRFNDEHDFNTNIQQMVPVSHRKSNAYVNLIVVGIFFPVTNEIQITTELLGFASN